jgi:hypothetical protein
MLLPPTGRAPSPPQIRSPRPESRRHWAARPPPGSGGGFEPPLDGSRVCPKATPGSARPPPGSGVGPNLGGHPFCSGVTHRRVWPGFDGVFRPGQWRFPTWTVWYGTGVGGLAVAACSDLGGGGVVWPGWWRRGLAWVVPAAFGLGGAGGVRPGCGGADLGRGVLSMVQIRCFNNTLVF